MCWLVRTEEPLHETSLQDYMFCRPCWGQLVSEGLALAVSRAAADARCSGMHACTQASVLWLGDEGTFQLLGRCPLALK